MCVVVALSMAACSTASDDAGDESSSGDVSQPEATTAAEGHVCEEDPSVVVFLQTQTGGAVFADVTYSIDGGARQSALCRQGACFIYDGVDQPITVYARYEGCPEDEMSTFGASCDASSSAELIFAFYEDCNPGGSDPDDNPGTTGGPSGSTGD